MSLMRFRRNGLTPLAWLMIAACSKRDESPLDPAAQEKLMGVLGRWMGLAPERGEKNSFKITMVVEMDRGVVWIDRGEGGGEARWDEKVELPAGFAWEAFHSTPKGVVKLLGPKVRLKMRGDGSNFNFRREQFSFVGSKGGATVTFYVGPPQARGVMPGRYVPSVSDWVATGETSRPLSRAPGLAIDESLLVTDQEFQNQQRK